MPAAQGSLPHRISGVDIQKLFDGCRLPQMDHGAADLLIFTGRAPRSLSLSGVDGILVAGS
ncbi:hypothetical protein ACK8GG_18070 [Micromonosporaceae bacterium DT55]|uniref:hypothetical protein n=1 Tax=Melissospora conviva TaxID=3388432 RepID=UPI003C18B055